MTKLTATARWQREKKRCKLCLSYRGQFETSLKLQGSKNNYWKCEEPHSQKPLRLEPGETAAEADFVLFPVVSCWEQRQRKTRMVVRIRLSRFGCKNKPFYRVMAADSRSPRDGKHLEVLGYYNPLPGPIIFNQKTDWFLRVFRLVRCSLCMNARL